jgi:hypothetical protein
MQLNKVLPATPLHAVEGASSGSIAVAAIKQAEAKVQVSDEEILVSV